jgi:predicted DNA-binding transcriptional regulator AlpA
MVLKIIGASFPGSKKRKTNGHTKAVAPTISLDQPGRLRVAHVMSLLGVGHSTLYEGVRRKRYPRPDGHDGKIPYWNTETIRRFLQG